jgi:hypothetical protein
MTGSSERVFEFLKRIITWVYGICGSVQRNASSKECQLVLWHSLRHPCSAKSPLLGTRIQHPRCRNPPLHLHVPITVGWWRPSRRLSPKSFEIRSFPPGRIQSANEIEKRCGCGGMKTDRREITHDYHFRTTQRRRTGVLYEK